MSTLDQVCAVLTRSLIVYDDFYEALEEHNIHPQDWPEIPVRRTALEYLEERMKRGHHAAAVLVAHELTKIPRPDDLPETPELLFAIYHKELRSFRISELTKNINQDPDNAEAYLANADLSKSQKEYGLLAERLESIYRISIEQHAQGINRRPLPGWPVLSDMIGGIVPGRVAMIMAATGFGKTTLATNLAMSASETMSVFYFNMEMTEKDFVEKLIVSHQRIKHRDYTQNPAQYRKEVGAFMSDIISRKFYFTFGKTFSVYQIASTLRQIQKSHPIDFIVVDYDQKLSMQISKEVPEWKALQIAIEQLEAIAKQFSCYVIILAQEGQDGEVSGSRRSKFPAATVMRFHKLDEQDLHGDIYLLEATKNRFGKRNATIRINYEPETSFLEEWGEYEQLKTDIQRSGLSKKIHPPKAPGAMERGVPHRVFNPSRYSGAD